MVSKGDDQARVDSLVAQALSLPEEGRDEFLAARCGEDAELRARVEKALMAMDEDATFALPFDGALPTPAPAAPSQHGLAGTRIEQYEILGRLGRGGMGVVYKALDSRLRRTVALKFLHLSMSDEPSARMRFFSEARSASALDHNNICAVHEFGQTPDGRVFIVMPFYEGQTLTQKLSAGALPIEEALDYGLQVATGLAAAHAKGILHRDIKPANVMVVAPDAGVEFGTAKILDFGLAKFEGSDLTHTGSTMGTAAYMSPEQAHGEGVDHRSDIWSLGVLLYEMLTGERPFQGKTEMAILKAVLDESPRPLRQIDPQIPEALEALVLRCLEKAKEDRFASVDEVVAALRQLLGLGSSQVRTGSLSALREPPRRERRRLVTVGAAVTVALLVLVLAVPASRQLLLRPLGGAAASAPRLVAVLPFINGLGDSPENRALADGLTLSLTGMAANLGTGAGALWVVPADEVLQRGVGTIADAHKVFGVDAVITGSVQRLGPTTEIILNLVDPTGQPPRTLDSRTMAAPMTEPLRERARIELAGLLGLEVVAEAGGGRAAVSAEAQALYLQGSGFLQRYEQAGNLERAIEAFGQAVEKDPEYGPAHAGLCEALWQRFRQTDEPETATRAVASCERAGALGSEQATVLVAVAINYIEMGEYRRARDELERALELEPGNAEVYRWQGWAHFLAGRQELAEAAFRQAIGLAPQVAIYRKDLGEVLVEAGRYEDAIELFEQSRQLTPESYLVYNALGVANNELNRVEEAEAHFRRSLELQPSPMAYRNLGYLYFREQRYPQAVESLESARDLLEEAPSFNDWILWSWLAHAYYWAGDRAAAEEAWRRLIATATRLYEVNPKGAEVLMLLADAHAALGELERARYYQNRLLALRSEAVYTRFYVARTYEMMGDRDLALEYIAQALEERYDPLRIERDPWLEELREEPSYQALRQRFVPASG